MILMKKIKCFLCLSLLFVVAIQAGNNSIWIHDGYGGDPAGDYVAAGIVLSNQDSIGGFQFDLLYDHAVLQFQNAQLTPTIDHMDLYVSEIDSGRLTLIVVNLGGESIQPMVEESIIHIEYTY